MKRKLVLAALAMATGMSAAPVMAASLVTNGSFEQSTITAGQKSKFAGNVTGWSGGANLTFIDAPGTADNTNLYLAVYGPFPTTSPDGGNFVEMDGDPNYSSAIYQTITGLTVGQKYDLDFYQAAGQQVGFTGPTTERWSVSFGGQTQLSTLFSLPQGGVGPWQAQHMTFDATAASQVLSFLAVGTPNGAPPISFLDGVKLAAASPKPEASTWAMMVLGFGMIGRALRRRGAAAARANA